MADCRAQDCARHCSFLLDLPRCAAGWNHLLDVAADVEEGPRVCQRWICVVWTRTLLPTRGWQWLGVLPCEKQSGLGPWQRTQYTNSRNSTSKYTIKSLVSAWENSLPRTREDDSASLPLRFRSRICPRLTRICGSYTTDRAKSRIESPSIRLASRLLCSRRSISGNICLRWVKLSAKSSCCRIGSTGRRFLSPGEASLYTLRRCRLVMFLRIWPTLLTQALSWARHLSVKGVMPRARLTRHR